MSYIKSGLILPAAIFLSGVLVGCLANWMINGRFDHAFDYIVKPLFWMTRIGIPASLLIGSLYFFIRRLLISTSAR